MLSYDPSGGLSDGSAILGAHAIFLAGGDFIGMLQGEVSDSDTIPFSVNSDAGKDGILLRGIRGDRTEGVDLSSRLAIYK